MTGQPEQDRLRWCFSTMGCPEASLSDVVKIADSFHIPAIELRSLCGTVDLPKLFFEAGWTPQHVSNLVSQHSVQLAVAGSSFKLTDNADAGCKEMVEFSGWADALGIPYVRAFGGGTWGKPQTNEDIQNAVRRVNWWRQEKKARGWRIEMLLETHDVFSGSEPCLRLNELLSKPLNLIWDSHHTWRYGGEKPGETWKRIGHLVRHVHIKDSVDKPSARHTYTYVLPGSGQLPLNEIVDGLWANRFTGFVSLEWEKLWHPYLASTEVALTALQAQPWYQASLRNFPKTAASPSLLAGVK